MSSSIHPSLVQALSRWFPGVHPANAFLHSTYEGFSGGRVYQVECMGKMYALKLWPLETPAGRIELVDQIISQASLHDALLTPSIRSVQPSANTDSRWQLSRWVPGEALPAAAPDRFAALHRLTVQGAEAIARAHLALSKVGAERPTSGLRSLSSRIQRIDELRVQLPSFLAKSLALQELIAQFAVQLPRGTEESRLALAEAVLCGHGQLRQHWSSSSPIMRERLIKLQQSIDVKQQWVLRDVHRDHVLFDQGKVSGIIDYDALGIDNVATDVARWAGSFMASGEPDGATLDRILAGYRRIRPFSEREEALARTIVQVNPLIQLANWLVWLIDERRTFPGSISGISGRITHSIASICRIW